MAHQGKQNQEKSKKILCSRYPAEALASSRELEFCSMSHPAQLGMKWRGGIYHKWWNGPRFFCSGTRSQLPGLKKQLLQLRPVSSCYCCSTCQERTEVGGLQTWVCFSYASLTELKKAYFYQHGEHCCPPHRKINPCSLPPALLLVAEWAKKLELLQWL